jgi:hypothetical protein
MKKRPLAIRAVVMAAASLGIATAIAVPLLTSPVGSAPPADGTAVAGPAASPSVAPQFSECPAIGGDTGCGILITLGPSGATITSASSPTEPPFDGNDDTLVGIVNNTGFTIPSVNLSSNLDIFGFDGDGICSGKYGSWSGSSGCNYPANPPSGYSNTGYEGPGTFFTNIAGDQKSGTLNLTGGGGTGLGSTGLETGSSTYFSLENSLTAADFTIPADFVVSKSASTSGPIYQGTPGDITYTLSANNVGGSTSGVSISDAAPANTTLVSGTPECVTGAPPAVCNVSVDGSGNITWTITGVAPGGTVTVSFEVATSTSTPAGPISNTALWHGPGCLTDPVAPIIVSGPESPNAVTLTPCPTNTTTTTVTALIPVTVTASNDTSVYGQTTPPTVTPTYSPVVTPATGATCSTTVVDTTPVGTDTGADTCTGASDPRYTFTYVPGNDVVTPAPLTATALSGSVVYGGGTFTPALRAHAIPAITAAITGFVDGQNSSVVTTQPTCTTTATSSSPVGSYPTTCTGGVAPNYTFNYVAGTLAVTPAPLTITASSGSANIGGTIPAVTAAYTGFVNGDSATSLTTAPTCSTTATSTSAAGVYPTNCTGAVDANYTITYVPGTMSLTAAPATAPATTPPAATGATATPTPTTAPSTSPAIAFTGALLDQEWLIGAAALILGAGLVLIGRRRRSPKHAAGRE